MTVSPLVRAVTTALVLTSAGVLALALAEHEGVGAPQPPVVQRVVIEGAHHASELSLRHLADLREGQSLLLDLDAVVEKVSRHPWVDAVTVQRDLGGTVRVRVTEHEPALLLAHDGLYRVSDTGDVFIRARSSDLDYPILTGLDPDLIDAHGDVAHQVILHALDVLASLDDRASLSAESLSEIHFDRDLGFTLILRGGSIVRLGFGEPGPRLARLDAIVRSGLNLDIPHEVDLDLADMAVVTPLTS